MASGFFALIVRSGGAGLLVLGILDSSFLFAPWGNDLLMVAVTVRNPHVPMMLYYAAMSAVGSVLGCLLVDMTLRPLGAKGLEKYLSARTLKRVELRVKDRAGHSLAVASLIPPPFPFTAFVMAAAALQYPRRRLLSITGATRMIRFVAIGALAIVYGERIVRWSENRWVQQALIWLVVICTIGSVVSVYSWVRRHRASA